MIETSSDLLLKSSAIFGDFLKMFGNVCLAFGQLLKNLWKPAENGQKSSERCKKFCYVL